MKMEESRRDVTNHGSYLTRSGRFLYRHRGILVAFSVACGSALISILVAYLKGAIGPSHITLTRGILNSFFCITIFIYKGSRMRPNSFQEFKYLSLLGFLGATGLWALYYAYQNMPTGDAAAIVYGYIAFTALFGRIFLKEPFGCFEIVLVGFTVGGVVLIMRPPLLFGGTESGQKTHVIPGLAAFTTCVLAALQTVILRALGKQKTDPIKSVLYSALSLTFIAVLSISIEQKWSVPGCTLTRLLAVAIAVISFVMYWGFTYALTVENALFISVITVSEVYLVFFADVLLFGTKVEWLSVAGIMMIVLSSLVTSFRKIYSQRKQKEKPDRQLTLQELECKESDIPMKDDGDNDVNDFNT